MRHGFVEQLNYAMSANRERGGNLTPTQGDLGVHKAMSGSNEAYYIVLGTRV